MSVVVVPGKIDLVGHVIVFCLVSVLSILVFAVLFALQLFAFGRLEEVGLENVSYACSLRPLEFLSFGIVYD